MPKVAAEIPGFYYDAEKNRYFPTKGPIPGSSRKPKPPPPSQQADSLHRCSKVTHKDLIHARELCGNLISARKGKLSFQDQYQNRHVSQPVMWKYKGTEKMANIALDHVFADVTLPDGIMEREVLLSAGVNGFLCLFQVGVAGQDNDPTQLFEVDNVWPVTQDHLPRHKKLLRQLGSPYGARTYMASDVSCIKVTRKHSLPTDDTMSKQFVITTLGSASAPGSVYLLDLTKPLDFDATLPIAGNGFYELASFKQTLWTIDCHPEGMRAGIGTNRGAALLNLETGVSSWVLRCKSDVLCLQLVHGNNILCGLRNGVIATIDSRQKQIKLSAHSSSTISMPSSVCCLASLNLYDQYFLASSMDGSIKLYDHRLIQRGPVQSYEGNVNSHTRIELGVDPSEKVVMSGGEDFCIRLWNIKSGELLFKNIFMKSIPSAVCWPRPASVGDYRSYWQDHSLGAWIGSYEGIFYMDWL